MTRCPQCDSHDVTAAVRLPPDTWKCQACGAVWKTSATGPHERARKALEVMEREGLDRRTVAERFGVAKGTVDSWVAAARQGRLR